MSSMPPVAEPAARERFAGVGTFPAAAAASTAAAPKPPLLTRPLALAFAVSFGAMTSFSLLLTVVPLYAASAGAGDVGAGMATGALMLSTVLAELAIPRLMTRFGARAVLVAGLLLLGAPSLLLTIATTMSAILAVCLVRGVGFAIVVVVGGALASELAPAQRRGEVLGLFGVVVGVPGIIALPLSVWLVDRVGYAGVFVAAAIAALAGLAAVAGIPARRPGRQQPLGMVAGLRTPALTRPAIVFAGVAVAAGTVVTFLPSMLADASANLVALGLLAQAVTAPVARWWAGRFSDRRPSTPLLAPGTLVAAAGIAILVVTRHPAAVVAGMLLFGVGFGIAQSESLTLMLRHVPPASYGMVNAVWNLAYDAGLGVGAAGFGLAAAQVGYPAALGITTVLMMTTLITLRHRR